MSNHSYANRANLEYIDQLYQQYKSNPASLDSDWRKFFEGFDFAQEGSLGLSESELDVYRLICAYRDYGHLEAQLNPLENTAPQSDQLQMNRFNLKEADLEKKFQIGKLIGKPNATLRDIIAHLRGCYCGKLTVQAAEALPEIRNWFIKEFEQNKDTYKIAQPEKKEILQTLTKAESLEKFIHTRYVGTKRFSVEGGDSLLPMLEALVSKGSPRQIEEVVIGMAHRGRINVLCNFMGKAVSALFADFNGPTELTEKLEDYDGDVKYHLGYECEKKGSNGTMKFALAFNPSHLETVNPVVLGMARAAQRRRADTKDRKKVLPLLIHGDAAFAGQGVVAEIFQMSQVRGYKVGGTIHIVVDNQVGFTTNPENSRSSLYPSDISKIISTPVLLVNGDDVESCVKAMDMAIRFRQEFNRDVVINMTCYRRFGHNEGDEPAYTQPLMYDIIKKHPTTRELYNKQLAFEGAIENNFGEGILQKAMDDLQIAYEDAKKNPPKNKVFKFDGVWAGLRKAKLSDHALPTVTATSPETIKKVGKLISETPATFNPHPKLLKLLESRKNMSEGKEGIDWGTGEMLAYGSLIAEGTSVRISGQDCVRGTFTHRHAGLYDYKTGDCYMPLKHLNPGKTEFCVYDSVLSEYAVLGFEYGNSVYDPSFLTIWEAQFGDFANGAQIIIDQYLAAAESKWQQMSGLVMLLPHGYEGQGPEHSSARLERFLQLCALYNMSVVNLTTPAQIFHALRRQVKRDYRKPLIVMSPKSLLRHPKAVSSVEDLTKGTFQEVINDSTVKDAKKVETVVFCSGKVYYDLLEEKEKQKSERTALVRLEQLYPFAEAQVAELLKSYSKAKSIVWCQEEPQNMGAYQHIYFRFQELISKLGLKVNFQYVGRTDRSSPAVGSLYRHKAEQAEIVQECFKI